MSQQPHPPAAARPPPEGERSGRSSTSGTTSSTLTPAPPPPLRFDLDGDDLPSRPDMRKWHKASLEEHAFLQRRIKKLKQDEEAALRKLQETQERAQRIAEMRERNNARRSEHQKHRENVLQTQHREKSLVHMARIREQRALAASRTRVDLEKKERVLSIRKEHAIHELLVLSREEAQREQLRARKRAIKETEKRWKESRGQHEAEMRRQQYREELEQLMNERESTVKSSAKLIGEEAQLLLRLSQLKSRNATALSQLSVIVGTPREGLEEQEAGTSTPRLPEIAQR